MTTGIAPSNGIEIAYETHGDPSDEPLLLVMGLGAQLIAWPTSWSTPSSTAASSSSASTTATSACRRSSTAATAARLHGASSWPAIAGRADRGAVPAHRHGRRRHRPARPPRHRLGPHRRRVDGRDDRPDDGHRAPDAGAHAHVDHVDHRRRRRRPAHARGACRRCSAPPATTRDEAIARSVETSRVISSPVHFDEAHARKRAEEAYDRCFNPAGVARQLLAILASGEPGRGPGAARRPDARDPRRRRPARHRSPAASARPSSSPAPSCSSLEGMGHDLPLPLVPQIVDAITDARRPLQRLTARLTTEGPRCLDPSPA